MQITDGKLLETVICAEYSEADFLTLPYRQGHRQFQQIPGHCPEKNHGTTPRCEGDTLYHTCQAVGISI